MSRFTRVPCDCGRCGGWTLEGPNVFPVKPDDPRPIVVFAVGGKLLQARFPIITGRRGSDTPILPEVIVMSEKPKITRPLSPDPYKTLPLESDLPKPDAEPAPEENVA
jgi:hypothetical protein